jgi:hypothetical protein
MKPMGPPQVKEYVNFLLTFYGPPEEAAQALGDLWASEKLPVGALPAFNAGLQEAFRTNQLKLTDEQKVQLAQIMPQIKTWPDALNILSPSQKEKLGIKSALHRYPALAAVLKR